MTNGFIFVYLTESIFPPVFGRRLQAQTAEVGGHILLEVEVSGNPEPIVTWYKDDEEIDVVVQTKKFGNNHTLVLESGISKFIAHSQ